MREQKRYSPFEVKLLNAIPDDGSKIATIDIISLVYDEPPLTARQSVLDCLKKLIRKIDWNDEAFEIDRSMARGSQPIFFWKKLREKQTKEDLFIQEST